MEKPLSEARVEKPPSEGALEGWPVQRAKDFEETLEEYMREAEAFGEETLEIDGELASREGDLEIVARQALPEAALVRFPGVR